MKFRSIMLGVLSALAITASITSCSDDDDDEWKEGSKVELAQTRAFILNEGSMGYNNSNLIYFDWTTNTVNSSCIFTQQNGKQLGDTGNDIITYDGKIIVAVNVSNYVALLNGSGVELSRISFADNYSSLGEVRNLVAYDGYVYVSTYGGYIVKIRINDKTLEYVGNVSIGTNLEWIAEDDGVLYAVVAGAYPNNDTRIAIVDTKNFSSVTYGEIMYNPDIVIAENGHIYVQGYGSYYDYPWGEYNKTTKTYTQIGNATAMAAYNGVLYLAYSVTDWTTYKTTTTLSTYNTNTGTLNSSFFKNVPTDLTTSFVYSISVNPYTGAIYFATSDYTTDGKIYQFDSTGNYTAQFTSGGLNPNKIVFLK